METKSKNKNIRTLDLLKLFNKSINIKPKKYLTL
jgi:hypothetical protein